MQWPLVKWETMNLKESDEEYMGGSGGRRRKREISILFQKLGENIKIVYTCIKLSKNKNRSKGKNNENEKVSRLLNNCMEFERFFCHIFNLITHCSMTYGRLYESLLLQKWIWGLLPLHFFKISFLTDQRNVAKINTKSYLPCSMSYKTQNMTPKYKVKKSVDQSNWNSSP